MGGTLFALVAYFNSTECLSQQLRKRSSIHDPRFAWVNIIANRYRSRFLRSSSNLHSANFAITEFSAPLCQAALPEGIFKSAMRFLKTASEMRLLRHRSASL